MARAGWSKLIPSGDGFHVPDAKRIAAYSEFQLWTALGSPPADALAPDARAAASP